MAYYYVSSIVGTATALSANTEKRTGPFSLMQPADVYASLLDLDTYTTLADGDIVCIADNHNFTYSLATNLNMTNGSNIYVKYVSVDSLLCDAYKVGAKESVTSGSFALTSGGHSTQNFTAYGISFTAVAGILDITSYQASCVYYQCGLHASLAVQQSKTGKLRFLHCNISCSTLYTVYSNVKIIGGTLYSSGSYLFTGYGGGQEVYGCDFSGSAVGIALNYYISVGTAGTGKLINCIMPTNYVMPPSYVFDASLSMELVGCEDYYTYVFHNRNIDVTTFTGAYLNHTYDGTNKLSYLLESSTFNKNGQSYRHKLIEIPAQNLSLTDTTYRVNLLLDTDTVAALTDNTFWVDLSHNDNVSQALGKVVSSRNTDILAVGTELLSSAEVWQGTLPLNTKAYQVDITLSAAQLTNVTNGNVVIYANLAVPNADVYVCPAVQIGN